ncbi:MAG: LLM class F420-dependent oxidoreductase [Euzebyales bacterium]|nr:LLM class F420-dependent oxidoreductase [Euzebyales bacterium]
MDFGLVLFLTDETVGPVAIGRAAEEAGFESLFVTEHTHIPVSRETPWPGGAQLPREYARTYDPFVALAGIAATTERLKVGTAICLVVEHDPIVLAKQVASLDRLSDGRFVFGVGGGWNREEMRNHGTDPATRFALLRERVLAMQAIWTQDEAAFHGDLVAFDPIWSWPKPVQQPHPAVLLGGNAPATLDRVVEFADGWLPNTRDVDSLASRIADLRRRCEGAGRARPSVTYYGARRDGATLEQLADAGVDRCLFVLPPTPADQNLERIGRYAETAARHR